VSLCLHYQGVLIIDDTGDRKAGSKTALAPVDLAELMRRYGPRQGSALQECSMTGEKRVY